MSAVAAAVGQLFKALAEGAVHAESELKTGPELVFFCEQARAYALALGEH